MQVELLQHFGSDEMVVNVARVSMGKSAENYTTEQNTKLISYLGKHKHTSPFRHPHLQFRLSVPIYVERQLFKHQVGWSANSISGRYVDFSDSYSIPTQLRYQSKSLKQGSDENVEPTLNSALVSDIAEHIERSKELYAKLCDYGVAKEQARVVLPLCLNTMFIWTGSLLAFVHLCNLRLKADAQAETREVVEAMLQSVRNIPGDPFERSLEALLS